MITGLCLKYAIIPALRFVWKWLAYSFYQLITKPFEYYRFGSMADNSYSTMRVYLYIYAAVIFISVMLFLNLFDKEQEKLQTKLKNTKIKVKAILLLLLSVV